jgi:hypothetical protein
MAVTPCLRVYVLLEADSSKRGITTARHFVGYLIDRGFGALG